MSFSTATASLPSGKGSSQHAFPSHAILFTYSTSHLSPKDKVRFYYALKGRDGSSGVIKRLRAEFLAKQVVLVPAKYDGDFQQFLRVWRLPFVRRRITIHEEVRG